MRIVLDEDDAPNPDDRETAERVITSIMTQDVISQGSFIIEGYSAARRVARALTAARHDERRIGFTTPFRMRPIKCAPGAPAVLKKWPRLRPLYHWIEVGGVRFQSYRVDNYRVPLISDDARIMIEHHGEFWTGYLDDKVVMDCGLTRKFDSESEAILAVLVKLR